MTNSLDERKFDFMEERTGYFRQAYQEQNQVRMHTAIETASNGLDPYKYLTTIFTYLPSQDLIKNPEIIDEFLPWSKFVQKNCK